jgi:hypothetical protein
MPKKDVRLAKWRETVRKEKLWRDTLHLGLETIANSPRLRNGVTAAFKYFGLDPKSLLHNRLLLGILADACFPRRTHTQKWDDYRYVLLARCFEAIESAQEEAVSDNKAAELIQRQFSGFEHLTADALRRRLPEARERIKRVRRQMAKPTRIARILAPAMRRVGKFSDPSILAKK